MHKDYTPLRTWEFQPPTPQMGGCYWNMVYVIKVPHMGDLGG
jgi:hypothetical protein